MALNTAGFVMTRQRAHPGLGRPPGTAPRIRKPARLIGEVDGRGADHEALGDAGELLDNQAKSAYKRRLLELADELKQAEADGDEPRAVALEHEKGALERELRRAFDRNGRARVAASAAEKARVNVTRTLRLAIEQIDSLNPRLGRYLKDSIRTGYFCSYRPDPDRSINWQL